MIFLRVIRVFFSRIPWKPAPQWSVADAKGLDAFLHSHTGRKFLAHMQNHVCQANEQAALSQGSPFQAGFACGMKGTLGLLELYRHGETFSDSSTVTDDLGDTSDAANSEY